MAYRKYDKKGNAAAGFKADKSKQDAAAANRTAIKKAKGRITERASTKA